MKERKISSHCICTVKHNVWGKKYYTVSYIDEYPQLLVRFIPTEQINVIEQKLVTYN